ncbi:MAG: DoxX family protein [Gemmatimonadetes bacterium]|nr:DoxX family protein [Gemmatimonadota bacterium]
MMAIFFLLNGFNHFRAPELYLRIIPPQLPYPQTLNFISGVAEIALAVLLVIPATSKLAAWGVIALLIAVFPANIYHLFSGGAGTGISLWALAARLPLQFVFMAWAYWHTSN